MKTVAFVPIRLNSKRVVGKNMKPLAGRPLLYHVPHTLLQVEGIDEVYVYCSSEAVVPHLPEGVQWLSRPDTLDSDSTLGAEIYDAFVTAVPADIYVLAHATSPFLKAETVAKALSAVQSGAYDSAFTAEAVRTFTWYEGRALNYDQQHIPLTQTLEPIYTETSGFYMFTRELWQKHRRRIGFSPYMAVVDRIEGIDIDYPDDFALAEIVAERQGLKK